MRDPDHDRHAPVDQLDRAADQRLALRQRQTRVFLGLDGGRNHHGRPAFVDDVIDLPPQGALVDAEIGRERGQRRHDQSGHVHDGALLQGGRRGRP